MRNVYDLDAPIRIFNILKKLNLTKYFYWITSHISEHDKKVSQKTGVKIITKENLDTELIINLKAIPGIKNKKILVLDDELDWINTISELLDWMIGCDVVSFQNPSKAIAYINSTPIDKLPVAYVID